MTKLAEYVHLVRESTLEAAGDTQHDMGEDSYSVFVRRALRRYMIDKPFTKVSAITGTGSVYITVNSSNLPDFVDGFSYIEQIEVNAPTVANNERPNYLEREEWDFYRDETGLRIWLKTSKPSSSHTIRVTYTVPHTIDGLDGETVDTVPEQDKEAIVLFAISQSLMALSAKAGGTSSPSMRSDVVNYRTKSFEFKSVSEQYGKLYTEWITNPLVAASMIRDLDFGFSFADSQPFLTHRSFNRR